MSRNTSPSEFTCPKCGAGSALWLPDPKSTETDVTLKCLVCASIVRLPRDQVAESGSSDPGASRTFI
jgi:transcription elongation factor Elf1